MLPRGGWRGRLNPIVAFWCCYVVTRPLGASFADWFSKPRSTSGLGLGDGTVSGLALIVFVALVGYVAYTKRDVQSRVHIHLHVPHPHLPHVEVQGAQVQPAEN